MTKERMSGALSPNYEAPVIKVVSFKVEEGFQSMKGTGTESFEQKTTGSGDNLRDDWGTAFH